MNGLCVPKTLSFTPKLKREAIDASRNLICGQAFLVGACCKPNMANESTHATGSSRSKFKIEYTIANWSYPEHLNGVTPAIFKPRVGSWRRAR